MTSEIRSNRRTTAFTMVEILLAMLILGIGLIMIATVLPVGANWNRQNIEESVGAQIARNAVAIIKTKATYSDVTSVGSTVAALPASLLSKLPIGERAYAYGVSPAYPATAPNNALYFWNACIRLSPDPLSSQTHRYDLFVFVMKKGAVEQTFGGNPEPQLAGGTIANVPVGSQGVIANTGTVFRALAGNTATVPISGTDNVIYAPPADGTTTSPLIYIYQTTIAF